MPTSNLALAATIVHLVHQVPHRRILDVGPGHGKYGLLCREYLNDKPEWLAAVEGEPAYLEVFPWLECIYDEVRVQDVMLADPEWVASFDCVLMVDVIEHLTKDDGLALLERCRGHVVICTPAEFFQNPEEGWTERHRSLWSVDDFAGRLLWDASQLGGVVVALRPPL
jgi:2-polyprenyl-3-methyl-5-hydroxy-6-metoxy-1,4-benzoquinol methylase